MSHDTAIRQLTALADDWADYKTGHAGNETYGECARQLRETLSMCGSDVAGCDHTAPCSPSAAAGPRQSAADTSSVSTPAIMAPRPPAPYCSHDPVGVLPGLRECSVAILPEFSRLDQDDRALVCQLVTRLTSSEPSGADLTESAGPDAVCGCGEPITQHDGVWLHIYNPELRGTDDHDASPG